MITCREVWMVRNFNEFCNAANLLSKIKSPSKITIRFTAPLQISKRYKLGVRLEARLKFLMWCFMFSYNYLKYTCHELLLIRNYTYIKFLIYILQIHGNIKINDQIIIQPFN